MFKSCAVIGGGVAGIQASLDLAEMGIETYLIERNPSVGGRMAQLDKTFPTNDCAMCILSPKLVEVGNHPYIHIISNAEVINLEGTPRDFKMNVLKIPRYVDEEKCTGCGSCMTKCPTKIPDPYNMGLSTTKCIRIPFPQAVPAIPVMDKDHCIYHQRGKCRICEKTCQAGAIDFEQKEQIVEIEVGSVILACGSREFDARLKNEYGYKSFPNVLTSIEFERILSASGPTGGHVLRPSDGKEPKRVAILQCVGSRDPQAGNEHCSAICCMQAAKDSIIASEHVPGLKTTIFYIDVRAYGKGFDRFVDSSKVRHDTRFICGRISTVEADPSTDNLIIQYNTPEGDTYQEEFDLLVLSVGLEPSESSMAAARCFGTNTDARGFISVGSFSPVDSSKGGIFTCGSISGPKDIPESVMEASGAASAAAALLGELPKKEIRVTHPPEKDIRGVPPRIGVFVCRCGINIASTVDVPGVVDYASTLSRVKHSQEFLFACAQDSQNTIKEMIEQKDLNRVVICACTPRTHEPLFQKTLSNSGLNPYLFEFANIREQCSWVHQQEPEKATEKAKSLARNAVAKVLPAEALYRETLSVTKSALVIGAGLAGMTASLDLARQGFQVHLVEKEKEPGGNLRLIKSTLGGEATGPFLKTLCDDVRSHPYIALYTQAKIGKIAGYIGNFKTTLETPEVEIEHGAVVIATGAMENRPQEYLYGQDDRIVTQTRLEELLENPDSPEITSAKRVVMIQCVGSRDKERSYCSRVCCTQAIKNAIRLKEIDPALSVTVLFRDMRAYGLREARYSAARQAGVLFVRYSEEAKPDVTGDGTGLAVEVLDQVAGKKLRFSPDLLVLSAGIVANPDNRQISQFLKVPLDEDSFFLEAHAKLRPVDFATDGVFVCGLAHYPKDIGETIAQAKAAAGRAATVLNKDSIEGEARVSYVREERCSGCGSCVEVCAYSAVEIDETKGVATINRGLCKGCGVCAATCRASAIDLSGFRNEQILSALEVI